MTGRQGNGPEDVDAAFAEIVAGLEREGVSARWPDHVDLFESDPRSAEQTKEPATLETPVEAPTEAAWRPSQPLPEHSDDDHFVPPEPPPLPPLRAGTIGALALFVIGILLLVAPGLIGLQSRIGTPLGLVAMSAGVGWLVLRMRQGPPSDSGWDDGAQL
ncbi:hypothetical protein F0L68_26285 [Solihabitans fulvus]|uniref:DUF308 domain-containing protein n=1 Tax=Solihabitans fulvus TaxID=1892852 RepID=A0A5B2WY99_9PSEU|nr:hypothetical protein [Solihabitans fulvus]KAA2256545.1 hypothetical protein F0L68_26285 [Solihabitans fulvus]